LKVGPTPPETYTFPPLTLVIVYPFDEIEIEDALPNLLQMIGGVDV
jgi:hypothetical protein